MLVVPIYKKGKKDKKENYRPVSLLPVLSKVLGIVVKTQIEEHFDSHGLFPDSQHGFRKHRSTTTAIISSFSEWVLKKYVKEYIGILLFDLSSAFDLIDSDILCSKLELYGFDNRSRLWIRSAPSQDGSSKG